MLKASEAHKISESNTMDKIIEQEFDEIVSRILAIWIKDTEAEISEEAKNGKFFIYRCYTKIGVVQRAYSTLRHHDKAFEKLKEVLVNNGYKLEHIRDVRNKPETCMYIRW